MKVVKIIDPCPVNDLENGHTIPKKGDVVRVSDDDAAALERGNNGKIQIEKPAPTTRPKILNKDLGDKDGISAKNTRMD